MKNKFYAALAVFAVISLALGMATITFAGREDSEKFEQKIVVFRNGGINEQEKEDVIKKHGGIKTKDLDIINGKAVLLSVKAQKELGRENKVLRIDDDVVVQVLDKKAPNSKASPPKQVLPWGIDRIDAEQVWSTTTADPIKVAVIDTGIELSHPDLQANIKGSVNTIRLGRSANDDNGHGTHVAGIIGAINNTIGVVGVGPKIDLYAVKALNRNGSGFLSDIIEGFDWAITNNMQVINMSLGTTANVQSFQDAVRRVNQAGIVQVAAAGNDFGGPVNFPAAYPEVIAVSATDSSNTIASFSSVGSEVDLAAPGVSIFSTYKGQTYRTLSGTSMATPHVAGTAALVLSVSDKCDVNLDGVCSPDEVKQRLQTTATDLGTSGIDNLYGAGLVNALNAVTL